MQQKHSSLDGISIQTRTSKKHAKHAIDVIQNDFQYHCEMRAIHEQFNVPYEKNHVSHSHDSHFDQSVVQCLFRVFRPFSFFNLASSTHCLEMCVMKAFETNFSVMHVNRVVWMFLRCFCLY